MDYEATPGAHSSYIEERNGRMAGFANDADFRRASEQWRNMALARKYMNNFSWLGRPLIQFPSDVMAIQELISAIRPTVVVETGIAHGGSLILSASMLRLNDIRGRVIGIDIDIRPHNKSEIDASSFADMITLIEASSIEPATAAQVAGLINEQDRVMVVLDSNHTHDHVLSELELYSPLVSVGSYMVVLDTHIEDMPDDFVWDDRPWGKGNNPKTAVHQWLRQNSNFEIDHRIESKLLITSAPDGFLFRRS